MEVSIDKLTGIVTKRFSKNDEAVRYAQLYRTFSHHVQPYSVINSDIKYKYINGMTLQVAIGNTGANKMIDIFRMLASALAENHRDFTIEAHSYGDICASRGHYKDTSVFHPSSYYRSTIHGDLNTGNIIVSDEDKIVFIDRLSDYGDMLYDFTFIMSLLCLYIANRDKRYLFLIEAFFDVYEQILPDTEDFYKSLRNNFINYGMVVSKDQHHIAQFPEWRFGNRVSEDLVSYENFRQYLSNMLMS